jgi:glucan 1,3-beta-glucosidase
MVYIDAGVYMISDTVVIPVGTRIFGEGWAQLCAYGSKFQNAR